MNENQSLIAAIEGLKTLFMNTWKQRNPFDTAIQISSSMPWILDYKERKHVYVWAPFSIALSFEDYGSNAVLPAFTWIALDFPSGTRITSNNANPVYIYIKCTDELLSGLTMATSVVSGTVTISPTAINNGIARSSVSEIVAAIDNGSTIDKLASPFGAGVSGAFNGMAATAPYGYNGTSFDALRSDNATLRSHTSSNNTHVPAAAGNTVVKASSGDLTVIVVNVAGTTGFQVFDNPSTNSGSVLYTSKTAPALGDIYAIWGWAKTGITVANTATGPDLTVYSN